MQARCQSGGHVREGRSCLILQTRGRFGFLNRTVDGSFMGFIPPSRGERDDNLSLFEPLAILQPQAQLGTRRGASRQQLALHLKQ